ncbi:hypothetical protein ACFU7Y_12305 [Kitasatospora sp. NPDC057542]|uniref:hypothetical protein n=1 Tax=Streptomycetaceae TaxID=2062 RepID=UPI001CCF9691|nr:hypothetical protein [Streptomyces sp. LS1784]
MPARNHRLPRDLAWPLTPTDIRTVLGAHETDAADLDFDNRPWEDGTALHVEWVPRLSSNYGGGIHPTWWCTVRIRVAPLPAADRAAARHILRQNALPELAAWISAARHAPEPWTLSRHSRSWRPEGSSTAHRDDQQPYL